MALYYVYLTNACWETNRFHRRVVTIEKLNLKPLVTYIVLLNFQKKLGTTNIRVQREVKTKDGVRTIAALGTRGTLRLDLLFQNG